MRALLDIESADNLARIALNFGDGSDTKGIVTIGTGEDARAPRGGWYTLDGVKLDKKPVRKGIYINNGKKKVMK